MRSVRCKFGLVVPATNTSMEHELWSIILGNSGSGGLDGVGIHTSNVITPSPKLDSVEALDAYRDQFVGGLEAAVDTALLARPHNLILGMSLEHVACANALDIAHVPDWAKERAVMELLATRWASTRRRGPVRNNMRFVQLTERREPVIGIPVLGINAVTFWYALRQAGIDAKAHAAGRLLREF